MVKITKSYLKQIIKEISKINETTVYAPNTIKTSAQEILNLLKKTDDDVLIQRFKEKNYRPNDQLLMKQNPDFSLVILPLSGYPPVFYIDPVNADKMLLFGHGN